MQISCSDNKLMNGCRIIVSPHWNTNPQEEEQILFVSFTNHFRADPKDESHSNAWWITRMVTFGEKFSAGRFRLSFFSGHIMYPFNTFTNDFYCKSSHITYTQRDTRFPLFFHTHHISCSIMCLPCDIVSWSYNILGQRQLTITVQYKAIESCTRNRR